MPNPVHSYSDEYKQKIKQEWYAAGKPISGSQILKVVSPDEQGRTPSAHTLEIWKRDYMWEMWADELDSRALTLVEDELVLQKVKMLKRHAKDAAQLQEMGLEYLKDKSFDSSSAAVSAIIRGAELERVSRGIGELIQKMAKMDDGALRDTIMQYIQRASENNQIIDVDEVPEKEGEESDTVSSDE